MPIYKVEHIQTAKRVVEVSAPDEKTAQQYARKGRLHSEPPDWEHLVDRTRIVGTPEEEAERDEDISNAGDR